MFSSAADMRCQGIVDSPSMCRAIVNCRNVERSRAKARNSDNASLELPERVGPLKNKMAGDVICDIVDVNAPSDSRRRPRA